MSLVIHGIESRGPGTPTDYPRLLDFHIRRGRNISNSDFHWLGRLSCRWPNLIYRIP